MGLKVNGSLNTETKVGTTNRSFCSRPKEMSKTIDYFMKGAATIITATLSAVIFFHLRPGATVDPKPEKASNLEKVLLSGWSTTSTWRKLVRGMRKDEVKDLFGEPTRIIKRPPFEFWYYPPPSARIVFDDYGRVYGWDEP